MLALRYPHTVKEVGTCRFRFRRAVGAGRSPTPAKTHVQPGVTSPEAARFWWVT
jgi:hypothetical protein